jgi:hypothetical protein
MAEPLASRPHRGRVNDRQHRFEIARQQRIEEGLVGVLQIAQEDVLLDRIAEPVERLHPARDLFVERRHAGRQQAMQLERVSFSFGEGRALVQQRRRQKLIASAGRFNYVVFAVCGI